MFARLSILIPCLVACAPMSIEHPSVAGLNPAPALGRITLETLEGKRAVLSELQAARPMLIAMWATWCDTCAAEFDSLRKLAPKAEAQGAYIVAVAEGESRATVADFVHARALGYPQLVDEPFALGDAVGARSVPTTLVLDRGGTVVYRSAALDREALVALDRVIAAH